MKKSKMGKKGRGFRYLIITPLRAPAVPTAHEARALFPPLARNNLPAIILFDTHRGTSATIGWVGRCVPPALT